MSLILILLSADIAKISEELFVQTKENENLQRELDLAQKKVLYNTL